MSAHNQIENLSGGILMAMMIGAERGGQRARDCQRQALEIAVHNAQVARARARRRKNAAAVAAQVAVGESRMARWIDRVSAQ